MEMEKFDYNENVKMETFSNFTNIAKDAVQTLIANIKENIKQYENLINKTNGQIDENKSSKEKCERRNRT